MLTLLSVINPAAGHFRLFQWSGVQIKCEGPTDSFNTLPGTSIPSSHFKMALHEGILPCLKMWNSHQKHYYLCTVDSVLKYVLTANVNSVENSLWQLNCIHRRVCVQQLVPSHHHLSALSNGMKDVMLSYPTCTLAWMLSLLVDSLHYPQPLCPLRRRLPLLASVHSR